MMYSEHRLNETGRFFNKKKTIHEYELFLLNYLLNSIYLHNFLHVMLLFAKQALDVIKLCWSVSSCFITQGD